VGNGLANRITGSADNNTLLGGAGDDTLDGGAGSDVLFGEGGADDFIIRAGGGFETIGDFAPGADALVLVGTGLGSVGAVKSLMVQHGADIALNLGGGDVVHIRGVQIADLNETNIQFG